MQFDWEWIYQHCPGFFYLIWAEKAMKKHCRLCVWKQWYLHCMCHVYFCPHGLYVSGDEVYFFVINSCSLSIIIIYLLLFKVVPRNCADKNKQDDHESGCGYMWAAKDVNHKGCLVVIKTGCVIDGAEIKYGLIATSLSAFTCWH